jgi:hypothetical protein
MRVISYDECAGRARIVRRTFERILADGEGRQSFIFRSDGVEFSNPTSRNGSCPAAALHLARAHDRCATHEAPQRRIAGLGLVLISLG